MFGIGLPELIVILVLALIVLGPEKLPEVAKQIAKFVNDLRKATDEFKKELELDKLDDIKNPVSLDNLLGDEIKEIKKDLSPPDFLKPGENKGDLLGGLGSDWKEADGRGKDKKAEDQKDAVK